MTRPPVDMDGLRKWLAEHPAPEKPYNAVSEERMAHVANGGTLRALPTDPAVSHRGRRDVADEADYVRRNGSWTYEPYSGDVA